MPALLSVPYSSWKDRPTARAWQCIKKNNNNNNNTRIHFVGLNGISTLIRGCYQHEDLHARKSQTLIRMLLCSLHCRADFHAVKFLYLYGQQSKLYSIIYFYQFSFCRSHCYPLVTNLQVVFFLLGKQRHGCLWHPHETKIISGH